MPTLEEVDEYVHFVCDQVTVNRGGTHFHARCPVCGDSKKSIRKKRFHLQFDDEKSIYWQCWNCGRSGNFYELYSILEGVPEEDAFKRFNKYNRDRIVNRLNKKQPKKDVKKIDKTKSFNYILNHCIGLNDEVEGYVLKQYQKLLKDFIEKRKLDYTVYVAYEGYFKNRIIIPIWEDENIVFFQGRRLFSEIEPKYLNPSTEKSDIIFNKERFERDKYIIVLEGIIDADTVGGQGTTIFGKELTRKFINKLKEYTDEGIILVMDNDEDGKKKLNEYIDTFKDIRYFLMPDKYNCKDLNELVTNNFINKDEVYNFVINNSFDRVGIKTKLNCKRS
mgnify:CR=1 FL=1